MVYVSRRVGWGGLENDHPSNIATEGPGTETKADKISHHPKSLQNNALWPKPFRNTKPQYLCYGSLREFSLQDAGMPQAPQGKGN